MQSQKSSAKFPRFRLSYTIPGYKRTFCLASQSRFELSILLVLSVTNNHLIFRSYAIHTLDLSVGDNYNIVYFNSTGANRPGRDWLNQCYDIVERRYVDSILIYPCLSAAIRGQMLSNAIFDWQK